MAKIEYVRCPRCELNYIDKKEKLCKVCKMELENKHSSDEEEVEQGICPICKINVINDDEEMCPMCAKEREIQQQNNTMVEDDPDESWRNYVDNDDTETESDEIGDMSSIHDEDELLDDIPLDEDDLDGDLDDEDSEDDDLDDDLDDDDADDFPDGDDLDDYGDLGDDLDDDLDDDDDDKDDDDEDK